MGWSGAKLGAITTILFLGFSSWTGDCWATTNHRADTIHSNAKVTALVREGAKIRFCDRALELVQRYSMNNPARFYAETLETQLGDIAMDPVRPQIVAKILSDLEIPLMNPNWNPPESSKDMKAAFAYAENGGASELAKLMQEKRTAVEFAKALPLFMKKIKSWRGDPFLSRAQHFTAAFFAHHQNDPDFPMDKDSVFGLTVSADPEIIRVLFELGMIRPRSKSSDILGMLKTGTSFQFNSSYFMQMRIATILAADELQKAMNNLGTWKKTNEKGELAPANFNFS